MVILWVNTILQLRITW